MLSGKALHDDFLGGGGNIIRHIPHFYCLRCGIPDDVFGGFISISGLADAANIDNIFIGRIYLKNFPVKPFVKDPVTLCHDDFRPMGVTGKTQRLLAGIKG